MGLLSRVNVDDEGLVGGQYPFHWLLDPGNFVSELPGHLIGQDAIFSWLQPVGGATNDGRHRVQVAVSWWPYREEGLLAAACASVMNAS